MNSIFTLHQILLRSSNKRGWCIKMAVFRVFAPWILTAIFILTAVRTWNLTRMLQAVHVANMGEIRNSYKIIIGKPEGRRPLGRCRSRWEDNIEIHLKEIGYDSVNWIHLILAASGGLLVNTVKTDGWILTGAPQGYQRAEKVNS
jgi:hypothetical protein